MANAKMKSISLARSLARAVGLGLAGLALACGAALACGGPSSTADPCPGDGSHTVGEYCDQIVPPLCRYAVDTCNVGSFDSCIAQSSATCWQGNRNRAACTVDAGAIEACIYRYAGADAAFDGSPPQGAGSGLSCDAVQAGFAPKECQSIVQLKDAPPGAR